jgi:hypothetical protein
MLEPVRDARARKDGDLGCVMEVAPATLEDWRDAREYLVRPGTLRSADWIAIGGHGMLPNS